MTGKTDPSQTPGPSDPSSERHFSPDEEIESRLLWEAIINGETITSPVDEVAFKAIKDLTEKHDPSGKSVIVWDTNLSAHINLATAATFKVLTGEKMKFFAQGRGFKFPHDDFEMIMFNQADLLNPEGAVVNSWFIVKDNSNNTYAHLLVERDMETGEEFPLPLEDEEGNENEDFYPRFAGSMLEAIDQLEADPSIEIRPHRSKLLANYFGDN